MRLRVNYVDFMTHLPITNHLCPRFRHGRAHQLVVTGISNNLFAFYGYQCLPTERGSFPLPAETESQHPTEVPAGERGARSFTAQLLCLLQG